MHVSLRPLLLAGIVAAPMAASFGCGSPGHSAAECTGTTTLQSGERVRGYDPAALLAPYWGTFHGTLTWAAGGQTSLTLISAQVPGEPLHGSCNVTKLYAVYTYGTVRLVTGDGGLNDPVTTSVSSDFPDTPEGGQLRAGISTSGMQLASWTAISPHLMTDVSRYTDPTLYVTIDWSPGASAPSSASIRFGGSAAPGTMDGFLVASISFP